MHANCCTTIFLWRYTEVKEGVRLPDEVLRHVADTLGERFTTPGT